MTSYLIDGKSASENDVVDRLLDVLPLWEGVQVLNVDGDYHIFGTSFTVYEIVRSLEETGSSSVYERLGVSSENMVRAILHGMNRGDQRCVEIARDYGVERPPQPIRSKSTASAGKAKRARR